MTFGGLSSIHGGIGQLGSSMKSIVVPSALLTDLISYWKLDESSDGSGAVTRNDSHGTNHLTDSNTTKSATGILSNGADFIATNSECLYVADNASLRMGTSDFTLCAWVKFDALDGLRFIAGKWAYTVKKSYAFFINGGNILFGISPNGTTTNAIAVNAFPALQTGVWYFVVGRHYSATNRNVITINYSYSTMSDPYTGGAFSADNPFIIGSSGVVGSFANFIDGEVDEVGLWKRYLSDDEIYELYNVGSGFTYPFTPVIPAGTTKNLSTATDATLAGTASRLPHQRSCFYGAGRYWAFYGVYDNATGPFDLNFISSTDGQNWNAATELTTFPIYDAQWSVYFDGTKVHVAKNIQTGVLVHDGLSYRCGTPQSNGTITWDADWQTALATGNRASDFSLSVATDGHAWLAYCDSDSVEAAIGNCKAIRNDNTDGTWATTSGFPVTVHAGVHQDPYGILSQLANGVMFCSVYEWATDHVSFGYTIATNGTVGTQETITTSNVETVGVGALVGRIETAGLGDGITHIAYQTDGQKIMYGRRNANGTLETEVELAATNLYVVPAVSSPRISFGDAGEIYITWSRNNEVFMCTFNGTAWSTPKKIVSASLHKTYEHVMPAEKTNGAILPMIYLTSDYTAVHKIVDVS